MQVLFKQFMAKCHSWSIVGQNLARTFLKLGHSVDIFSTNGMQFFPDDLKPNLIGYVDEGKASNINHKIYDCCISYTSMKNFPSYLSHSKKNRFGIWTFEWPILPFGFAKNYKYADYILAPSEFAKFCFVNSQIPEDKIKVIPHGIDFDKLLNNKKYKFKTEKSTKILVNIGQNHRRKNIENMFKAYLKAFSYEDDVCLIAKISKHPIQNPFDVDPFIMLSNAKQSVASDAEIELITDYVPDVIELYNSCDIVYSLSHSEGFNMVALEALAMNKINVCPRYSGQLDFLDDTNSLLIEGNIVKTPINHQYWGGDSKNTHFESNIDDAADKLRFAVANKELLFKQIEKNNIEKNIKNKYDWITVTKQILELCQ